MVSHLFMPVLITTGIYYIFIRHRDLQSWKDKIKAFVFLSTLSLLSLVVWNIADIFLIISVKSVTLDVFWAALENELFLELCLFIPVSVMIAVFFSLWAPRKKIKFSTINN
jgi:hypothetical protein